MTVAALPPESHLDVVHCDTELGGDGEERIDREWEIRQSEMWKTKVETMEVRKIVARARCRSVVFDSRDVFQVIHLDVQREHTLARSTPKKNVLENVSSAESDVKIAGCAWST